MRKNEEIEEPRSPDPRSRSVGSVRIRSGFVRVGGDIECTEGMYVCTHTVDLRWRLHS